MVPSCVGHVTGSLRVPLAVIRGMLPTNPLPLAVAPDGCRCQAVTRPLLRRAVAAYVRTTRILRALSTVPAAILAEPGISTFRTQPNRTPPYGIGAC